MDVYFFFCVCVRYIRPFDILCFLEWDGWMDGMGWDGVDGCLDWNKQSKAKTPPPKERPFLTAFPYADFLLAHPLAEI